MALQFTLAFITLGVPARIMIPALHLNFSKFPLFISLPDRNRADFLAFISARRLGYIVVITQSAAVISEMTNLRVANTASAMRSAVISVRRAHTGGQITPLKQAVTRIYNTPAKEEVMRNWKPQVPGSSPRHFLY